MAIEAGISIEASLVVDGSMTADTYDVAKMAPVLSTPHLIGFMEGTAHSLVYKNLDHGQSSVGAMVNIRHLAATPVGMKVRMVIELVEVTGKRLRFHMEAWDEVYKIAEGEHERYIIDWDRFMAGVEKKEQSIGR
jgi:fluoroacetyl-CoA thioesterase